MPKRVRMVAEVLSERCTGCKMCERVCPTVALSMRQRRDDEPGRGRTVAALDASVCYNAQACLEICPEDAIVMRELEVPFDVGFDVSSVDEAAVAELCMKAGYPPKRKICLCTDTRAEELAAAILAGATTPEQVSRATGARTGCVELCLQPILELLAAAGHGDAPKNPRNGFQWYGLSATLLAQVRPDGSFDPEFLERYKVYDPRREILDMLRLMTKDGSSEA